MGNLVDKFVGSFRPAMFGDCDQAAMESRFLGYFKEAEAKTTVKPTDAAGKLAAQEAWMRYRAFDDALLVALSSAEQIAVDAEGSVRFDLATRIKAFERNRDAALEEFSNLLADHQESTSQRSRSGYLPVEFTF